MEGSLALTFLAADAQIDPGKRLDDEDDEDEDSEDADDAEGDKEEDAKKKKESEEEDDPVPVDFTIVLTDSIGLEYRVKLGDFQNLQPAIKPQVFK